MSPNIATCTCIVSQCDNHKSINEYDNNLYADYIETEDMQGTEEPNQEGWIGTSMVIVIVIMSCGAVICVIGVVKKTRDYLHIQSLSNRDEDCTNDTPGHDVEIENDTNPSYLMTNSERGQSLNQSQNLAHHPSAPPDYSIQGMPLVPPSTHRDTHSSEYVAIDQNSPLDFSTTDPPSYSEAMKF